MSAAITSSIGMAGRRRTDVPPHDAPHVGVAWAMRSTSLIMETHQGPHGSLARFVIRIAALSFLVIGCATTKTPEATPRPQPPAPRIAVPRGITDASEGVRLVVRTDVVDACPALVQLRAGADAVPVDTMWLVILDRLADCMQNGELRGRTIVLRGAQAPRDLVAGVLVDRGVDPARVATIAAPEEVGTMLVIALAPSPTFAPDTMALRAP